MKTALIAAAVGIAVIASAPAAATTPGDAQQAPHVTRFTVHQSSTHPFDAHHVVGADVLRRNGGTVGYDTFTEYSNPTTKTVDQFALALKGGLIVGRVVQQADNPATIDGPILSGTGRFAGIRGTATLKVASPSRQILILRYRL